MLLIKLSIDISMLAGIIAITFAIGFLLRRSQIGKLNRKVNDLEKEMIANHAEILELQRDRLLLEEKLKGNSNIPVIPITAKEEKLQDKSFSKK